MSIFFNEQNRKIYTFANRYDRNEDTFIERRKFFTLMGHTNYKEGFLLYSIMRDFKNVAGQPVFGFVVTSLTTALRFRKFEERGIQLQGHSCRPTATFFA